MKIKRLIAFLYIFIIASISTAGAQNISIRQIDTSRLLINQEVRLYIGLSGEGGEDFEGAEASMFTVYEAPGGEEFRETEVKGLVPQINRDEGVTFFLLIDNSGSMYDTIEGEPTDDPKQMRISHAKNAVNTFLNSIESEKDKVGIASFATRYTVHSEPVQRKVEVAEALEDIEEPERLEAYTELYASLVQAAEDIATYKGRTAVIVLSDGENFSYFEHEGEAHPEWGEKVFEYTEALEALQREGTSVFAINYGDVRDRNLGEIALKTGGTIFDAEDPAELEQIYLDIRESILSEYLLTYRAGMTPAERTQVRVVMERKGFELSDERCYYSSTVFGIPRSAWSWFFLIPLALALFLWWLLSRFKLAQLNREANLQILSAGAGGVSTKYLPLKEGQTVIGGAENADMTIAGNPAVREKHATVVYDDKTKKYTLVSDEAVKVNNRLVKKKDLKAGDVIDVGGTTIVFDDELEKKD